ncbi:hypothetical protein FZEAL_7569 [Fusarium zealandicum]|uniref:Uncharacterized protein n=1 Tax=Fusarium zealandicum TaxID=1053134 RepID=A0A8H4UGA3_9HYPO|nr:hypothetical protein FZEAL_7569 [Fusarium zealandicum]
MNFSCYVSINNKTRHDLLLDDSGVNAGSWPLRQPLNVIKAGSRRVVHLDQPSSFSGSKGWLRYVVKVDGRVESFKLEFECPSTPLSSNHIQAETDSSSISLQVTDIQTRGSPLTGNVDVCLGCDGDSKTEDRCNEEALFSDGTHAPYHTATAFSSYQDDGTVRATYDIGAGVSYPVKKAIKHPIHESIVVAAFINSKIPFPRGTFYNNINDKQWEYFRGVVWNDDPSCLLFVNKTKDNRLFGLGAEWLKEFKFGDDNCMTRRSHLGDLQFLHGMGSHEGEKPQVTRKRLLAWIEIMYKLACGDQGVSEDDTLGGCFPNYFHTKSVPSTDSTLRDLLLATTPDYKKANLRQRALGTCLHIISDSYALGHTQRRLKNPSDLVDRDGDSFIEFQPGTYGDWGPVLCFHTFGDQDSGRHAHYDGPIGPEDPKPRDVESFNEIVGARNAIQGCTTLIDFFADKTRWEDGVHDFLKNKVFALDKDARPADHFVDDEVISSAYRCHEADDAFDYEVGLQRKLAMLETGSHDSVDDEQRRMKFRLALAFVLTNVLLFTSFAFAYCVMRAYELDINGGSF